MFRCFFGHKPITYCGGPAYGRVRATATDGIGRHHAYLEIECERCGEYFHVMNIHLMTDEEVKEQDAVLIRRAQKK